MAADSAYGTTMMVTYAPATCGGRQCCQNRTPLTLSSEQIQQP